MRSPVGFWAGREAAPSFSFAPGAPGLGGLGISTVVSARPSARGIASTVETSASSEMALLMSVRPMSMCAISRPRNVIVNFTLSRSVRNVRACCILNA